MAEIQAFPALRFTDKAGFMQSLTCPPYDIISEEGRNTYLSQTPYNIIRLELPQVNNGCKGISPYAIAGETLNKWLNNNILACDDKDSFYIYEENFFAYGQRKSIKGLICRVKLEEFEKGIVLPHEETLSKAKEDRFQLMCATGCNFSSIYSLYFDQDQTITPWIDSLSSSDPECSFEGPESIHHRVWQITDLQAIQQISSAFADKKLYIADGHHRYETALRYRDYLRSQGVVVDEGHPANYIMMTLVNMEHDGLVVFPTHRIVRGLDHFDLKSLLHGCEAYFTAISMSSMDALQTELAFAFAQNRKSLGLYADGSFYLLTLLPEKVGIMAELLPGASQAYQQLDVNILHLLILERLLGIDQENMANQKNLIYSRDISDAVNQVDSGQADCAFLINPTKVEEIAQVAGAGEKMPQKSTYFYPKLITGHVMNQVCKI